MCVFICRFVDGYTIGSEGYCGQDIVTHVQKGVLVVHSSHQCRLHNPQQAASTTPCIVRLCLVVRLEIWSFTERIAQKKKREQLQSVVLVSPQY